MTSKISKITRKDILLGLMSDLLDIEDILSKVLDFKGKKSSDSRYKDMEADRRQHRKNNPDWDDDWFINDERLYILDSDDDVFLGLLCSVLHPDNIMDVSLVMKIANFVNSKLRRDGFELISTSQINGSPLYEGKKLSLEGKTNIKFYVESFSKYNKIKSNLPNSYDVPCVILVQNSRNDFGYRTLFMAYFFQDRLNDKEIGYVKILEDESDHTNIPNIFDQEKSIIFYGGEPLMNKKTFKTTLKKIREYQDLGKLPKETKITLITNGSLIDQEVVDLVKEYNILIAISIDGDKEMNNSNRIYKDGKDSHDKVIEGYNLCKENGINTGISCTISEEALERKGALLSTLIDEYKATNVGFNMLFSTKEYPVEESYNKKASDFIIEAYKIFREKNIYEDRIMRKIKAFSNSENIIFDCGAEGGSQIVIAPDGDVGICQAYIGNKKHFVTNVSDKDFDPQKNLEYQERSKRSPFNMHQCQECEGLGICGGGCIYQAEEKEGTIWGLDKRFCAFTKATIEFLIWDLYEILSKQPE